MVTENWPWTSIESEPSSTTPMRTHGRPRAVHMPVNRVSSVRGTAIEDSEADQTGVAFELLEKGDALELVVSAAWFVDGKSRSQVWRYTGMPPSPDAEKLPDISRVVSAVVTSSEF